MKFIKALSSRAPFPLNTLNLDLEILVALSKSKISKSTPKSQWAFISKSNFLGSPHFLISKFSVSSKPTGTSLLGVFGISIKYSLISSSISFKSSSKALISSDNFFKFLKSSVVSSPFFFICGTCLDNLFCSAFIDSTFWITSRLFSSVSKSFWIGYSPLLFLSASTISSGLFLILLISNITFSL